MVFSGGLDLSSLYLCTGIKYFFTWTGQGIPMDVCVLFAVVAVTNVA